MVDAGATLQRAGRTQILVAARRVLATLGYARFTMRAVAREAGMAVGNVVYYFPSKRSLVHALIESLVAHYQGKSNEYLRNAGRGSGFAPMVEWFIRDSVSRETSRVFRELWTMGLHDPAVAAAMDCFYAESHRTAVALLRVAWPRLSRQRAHDIVQLMGTISEGSNVIYATAPRSARSLTRVARLAGELLVYAAGAPPKAQAAGRRRPTG
jgi:AcrR family transcriptional regulator